MLAHHYLKALRYPPSEPERDALTQRGADRPARCGRPLAGAERIRQGGGVLRRGSRISGRPRRRAGRIWFSSWATPVSTPRAAGDELLEQARDLFLDGGRLEKAAEAMVLLGELLWMRGHPGTFDHLEKAADLLADKPASYSKAYVMCSLARFNMIRDHNDAAIEVGLQALDMVDQTTDRDLRGHALASVGLARARIGDPRGIADLEESVAIAVTDNSLESVRAYANLGNALVEAGELLRAFELYQQGRDAAARFGDADRIRWFEVERMYECYWQGRWDEAVALSDEIVAEVGAGFPTAFEQDARLVRSRIRFARDEVLRGRGLGARARAGGACRVPRAACARAGTAGAHPRVDRATGRGGGAGRPAAGDLAGPVPDLLLGGRFRLRPARPRPVAACSTPPPPSAPRAGGSKPAWLWRRVSSARQPTSMPPWDRCRTRRSPGSVPLGQRLHSSYATRSRRNWLPRSRRSVRFAHVVMFARPRNCSRCRPERSPARQIGS